MRDSEARYDVIIIGGGPAGMFCAYLLARAGIAVLVLEKHAAFFRDFRGDTVHPSTMEALAELGLLDRFLARPHHRIDHARIDYNGHDLTIGDLSHLRMPAPFIAMMPQWEFLDFLRDAGQAWPSFNLRMNAEVTGFVETEGRVSAVRLADGCVLSANQLVIACDGRSSLVRQRLPVENLGAPIDVFWFALPKQGSGSALRGAVRGHRLIVMIDRGDYWQCAFVIAKGRADEIKARGIEAFRGDVLAAAPDLGGIAAALPDWDAVRLLSVSLDRLKRWSQPGLLAIGDAAHAMSPVGGIGINLAIQDAIAAANLLAGPLQRRQPVDPLLQKVEQRRLLPTRLIQAAQQAAHDRVLQPVIAGKSTVPGDPPWALRMLNQFPLLRRIPGRFIGRGIRQEHVRAPEILRAARD